MNDLRTADGVRDRIDRYLRDSGVAGESPRVVPLTGDASDRKYFRIIPADGPSIVLALHAGPIDFATLPFANVGDAAAADPAAGAGHPRTLRPARDRRAAGSRRRHAAGAPRRGVAIGARGALPPGGGADRAAAAARRRARSPTRSCRTGIAFDVEKLTWELDFFAKHFVEGYRGSAFTPPERTALAAEWALDRRPSWRPSRACCAIATTTAAT